MKKLLIAILFIGLYTGYLMGAEGKKIVLHPVAAGEVGGAVATVHSWYKDAWAADENIYKIAKVDLNGDGIQEVIVHMRDYTCQQAKKHVCSMYIMKRNTKQPKQWDKISGFIKAKEVRILPTATMGWYDLRFDDTLYVYSKYSAVGSYGKGEKPGQLVMSKSDLNTQTIEHFGLSWKLDGDWISKGQKKTFKSHQEGYSNYEGYFPGANKRVSVGVSVSPKKTVEAFVKYHSDGTPFKLTPIGSGKINGHGVKVYWLSWGSTGEVYLIFDEEEYFVDPADKNSDFFPMHIYVNISGKLFYDLRHEAIQHVLNRFVTPFLHTLKVTEANTFATDTTAEMTPFRLVYDPNAFQKEETAKKQNRGLQRSAPVPKRETGFSSSEKPLLESLRDACYTQNAESCYMVGMEYKNRKREKLAKDFFEISCDLGNLRACTWFNALVLETPLISRSSRDKEIKSLQRYCEKGVGNACKMLAYGYKKGKVLQKNLKYAKKYYTKAFNILKKSCDSEANSHRCTKRFCGYDIGLDCEQLGSLYKYGYGVKKNSQMALNYYQKSCEYNAALGCLILGFAYSDTDTVSTYNLKAAEKYYRKACDVLKYEEACSFLQEFKAQQPNIDKASLNSKTDKDISGKRREQETIVKSAKRKYEGAWFEIEYPGNFAVIPSMKSKTRVKGYDSVFFASPDEEVYFYLFSPQWGGTPGDILLNKETEKMLSCKKSKRDGVLYRRCSIEAKDGSYYKYYEDIEDPRINTRHVFAILYHNRKAYERYKALYAQFKKSLEQFSN